MFGLSLCFGILVFLSHHFFVFFFVLSSFRPQLPQSALTPTYTCHSCSHFASSTPVCFVCLHSIFSWTVFVFPAFLFFLVSVCVLGPDFLVSAHTWIPQQAGFEWIMKIQLWMCWKCFKGLTGWESEPLSGAVTEKCVDVRWFCLSPTLTKYYLCKGWLEASMRRACSPPVNSTCYLQVLLHTVISGWCLKVLEIIKTLWL